MMTRWAMAALAALLLTGPAAAGDEDPRWRRLAAKAAEYNARDWVRVEGSGGRHVWVEASQAAQLTTPRSRPVRLLVLWPDALGPLSRAGVGVGYSISEQSFDCGGLAITRHDWFFGADGRLMSERAPVINASGVGNLLFETVCEGAVVRLGRRVRGAAAVLAGEASGGRP